jgi:hypothetical protein
MIQKQIWEKIAKGEKLNPHEQFYFTEFGNRLQFMEMAISGMQLATGGMKIISPLISNPRFETSPLSVLTINRQTDTSITQDTDAVISFENGRNGGQHFTWESSNPTVIGLQYLGAPFLVTANVAWAANGSGYRNAKVNGYDKDGNSLGNGILFNRPGGNFSDDIHTGMYVIGENDLPTMASMKITVAQGSGAALTLKYILVAFFIL